MRNRNLSGQQFKQLTLFPGHEPADEIKTASPWARSKAGRGARAHYAAPEDSMGGVHEVSVSVPKKNRDGSTTRRQVGSLWWHPDTGEVVSVKVQSDYRERGIARGLWHLAKQFGGERDGIPRPEHSDVQTPMGREWARRVGD